MFNYRGRRWWGSQEREHAGAPRSPRTAQQRQLAAPRSSSSPGKLPARLALTSRGSRVLLAALVPLTLGVTACSDEAAPPQPGLRVDGPPDVLAVLAASNRALSSSLLLEEATYCRPNDAKRPARIFLPGSTETEVCPVDLSKTVDVFRQASPAYWYVRFVFDERLDLRTPSEPSPESGGEVRLTEEGPVTLSCDGAPVDYAHFYVDNGDKESWPPGPSLKIRPRRADRIPANAMCEVTLEDDAIADTTGVPVEDSQLGPYRFQLAPISLLVPTGAAAAPYGTTGAIPTLLAGNPAFRINFNHYLDPSSFTAASARVFRDAFSNDPATELTECGGGTQVAARVATFPVPADQAASVPAAMTIADATILDGDWAPATQYRVELGGTVVRDRAGGANLLPRYTLCFRTR